MNDFEHEIELDDGARMRWMTRDRKVSRIVKRESLEFDENGKLVRR
jgi:hypothetical protein